MKLEDIQAKVIQHSKQRYCTLGDYFFRGGKMMFRVSELGRWEYEFAVLVHEIVEWGLVKHRGVKIEDIDAFDKEFEEDRARGLHGPDDEPGDDPRAPYHREHCFATAVERMLIAAFGLSWQGYVDACAAPSKVRPGK